MQVPSPSEGEGQGGGDEGEMRGRSPGRTPGVISNRTAVPLGCLLSVTPTMTSPLRVPMAACGRLEGWKGIPSPRGGGSGWGIAQRQQPTAGWRRTALPLVPPPKPSPTGGGLSDTGGGNLHHASRAEGVAG